MSVFTWEGTNPQGKRVTGQMEAMSAQAVYNSLRSQQITPNMKKIKVRGQGLQKEISIPGFAPKPKTKDIVVFTRQFATMIDAGLPIVQGLEVLGKQHENPAMRKVLTGVKEYVQTGGTLADGMRRHPRAFDELFTNMIAAGEAGGILDIILERLANYLEKSARLKRQVLTAMIYPGVVISAAVVVTSILLIFVIPTFAELFQGFGSTLPAPTRFVIALSDFVADNCIVIFGTAFSFFYLLRRFLRTDRGKEVMHPIALRLPIFGGIIKKVAVARFSRTLGTMMSSGVPILDALMICSKTAGNKVVEQEVGRVRAAISEGKSIAEPLMDSAVFPPMVVQMIAVGESTGALDAMLQKVADFYEDEVENAVNGMKQLIEPLMILILGGLVGGLVVAMYLPIFQMGDAM